MSQARVAVVVPTRGRDLLARCLEALAAQTRPPDVVVVVDDASRAPTERLVEQWSPRMPVRLLRQPAPSGPAAARNRGWRGLDADLIAFTDDDCRPDPGWLAALEAAGGDLAWGRTQPDADDGPIRSIFDRTFWSDERTGRFSSCNVMYRRELLEKVGGFDESFRRPWGEDTDLAHRALATGAQARYAPQAIVNHAVLRPGARAALRERWRHGDLVRVVKRHPSMRGDAVLGPFLNKSHRAAVLAWAGIALSPLNRLTLLAVIPWIADTKWRVWYVTGTGARDGAPWVKQMAELMLLDSVEMASLAWASARHGSLLL